MNTVKNIHLLESINSDVLEKINFAGSMHKRHAALTFKIKSFEPGTRVVIQVVQEKSAAKNYFDAKRLVEIVHETFDGYFPGMRIDVQPIPYVESPVDVVNADWIEKLMSEKGIRLKDIIADTGITKTQLSAYINEAKPLTQTVKAFFFYYFLSKNRTKLGNAPRPDRIAELGQNNSGDGVSSERSVPTSGKGKTSSRRKAGALGERASLNAYSLEMALAEVAKSGLKIQSIEDSVNSKWAKQMKFTK